MFKSIILHPYLLLNGVMNIAYYMGEVFLYRQPLGVVFIVIAALASSFVIVPLESVFGMVDTAVQPLVIVLGVIGSIMCVVEQRATREDGTLSDLWAQFCRRIAALLCCRCSEMCVHV
jgi:hypothetical protein